MLFISLEMSIISRLIWRCCVCAMSPFLEVSSFQSSIGFFMIFLDISHRKSGVWVSHMKSFVLYQSIHPTSCPSAQLHVYPPARMNSIKSIIAFVRFLFLDYCLSVTIHLMIVRLDVVTCKVVARLLGNPAWVCPCLLT